ncbi:MAG: hypothetical protein JRI74_00110, partial [Deltaproteobacteria bacterium]|nr:hypothetical protein [Deltaproteobacteria bacterium]
LRKDIARKSVTPFYFKVKKGEMLVREGERITSEQILKISEQQKYLKENESLGTAPAMSVLIFVLLSAMYMVGFMNNPSSRTKIKDLLFSALTLLTIFLIVIAWNFMSSEIARGSHFFSCCCKFFSNRQCPCLPCGGRSGGIFCLFFYRFPCSGSWCKRLPGKRCFYQGRT